MTSQTYAIDPVHSEVGFAVRHLMISKVRGHFTRLSGTIGISPQSDLPTSIEAVVDAASVNTREEKRDEHLRSADFFEVDKYPQITFTSTSITGSDRDFTVVGELTLHGTTQTVTLKGESGGHATDPWGNARIGYSATARINRKDFGVNFNQALETGGVMVSDEVDIALEISAVRQK